MKYCVNLDTLRERPFVKNNNHLPVHQLVQMYNAGHINMNPFYQRGLVWTQEQKERLIDSMLWGVAVPSLYFRDIFMQSGCKIGSHLEVVDGKQRLSTIAEFMADKLTYQGKLFSELPEPVRGMFSTQAISCYMVEGLDDDAIVELYERLNFGGVPHLREDEDEKEVGMVTVMDLCLYRLGMDPDTPSMTYEEFQKASLPMMGGCQGCGATVAAYNSFPSTTGYLRCRDCIEDLGFKTVEEANQALFDGKRVTP